MRGMVEGASEVRQSLTSTTRLASRPAPPPPRKSAVSRFHGGGKCVSRPQERHVICIGTPIAKSNPMSCLCNSFQDGLG